MKKKSTKKIANLSLVENSDYFYRDSEMYRTDVSMETDDLNFKIFSDNQPNKVDD